MTVETPHSDSDGFESRFASLEAASRNLSLDVQTLNETLRVVGALQKEQAAQRLRQDEADRNLKVAKDEADARETRTRRTFGGVSLALAVLLPVVSILVYWSLIQHVDDLLRAQKASFYNGCMTRNEATKANISRELLLSRVEDNLGVQKIHRDSAASLQDGLVDCNTYLQK